MANKRKRWKNKRKDIKARGFENKVGDEQHCHGGI